MNSGARLQVRRYVIGRVRTRLAYRTTERGFGTAMTRMTADVRRSDLCAAANRDFWVVDGEEGCAGASVSTGELVIRGIRVIRCFRVPSL